MARTFTARGVVRCGASLVAALVATLVTALLAAPPALAQATQELAAELEIGGAWSLPLPLTVAIDDARSTFTARYSTRPFQDAPYYSYRIARASNGRAVELEMLHHKLYLENPRDPVQDFQVSHGYNQAMLNVAQAGDGWGLRLGLGIVVAHPEGRIGGRDVGPLPTILGGGYHIAGIATQFSVARRHALSGGATAPTATFEAKITAASAHIAVNGGSVTVPNIALHVLGGVGVRRRW
jgi:hypothetical protein